MPRKLLHDLDIILEDILWAKTLIVIHGLVIRDWILISAARLSRFCCHVRCLNTNTSSTPILDADISASIATLYAVKMGVG